MDRADGDAGTWIALHVGGVRSAGGNLRVQVYGGAPADFLAKGKKLLRVAAPSRAGSIDIRLPLPGPGRFSLVVMHDRKANGRADFFTEGFGFSNNPRLGFPAPDLAETLFVAPPVGMEMNVFLTYALLGRLAPDDPRAHPAGMRRGAGGAVAARPGNETEG